MTCRLLQRRSFRVYLTPIEYLGKRKEIEVKQRTSRLKHRTEMHYCSLKFKLNTGKKLHQKAQGLTIILSKTPYMNLEIDDDILGILSDVVE